MTDNNLSQYKKLNMGMAMATQPYVLITNNDTTYISGHLEDLCVEGSVTRPLLDGERERGFGHCFCVPKKIWEDLGHFDDGYSHGYYDDNDWQFKLQSANIPITLVTTVNIHHPLHGGTTLENIEGIGEAREANMKRFKERWGRLP